MAWDSKSYALVITSLTEGLSELGVAGMAQPSVGKILSPPMIGLLILVFKGHFCKETQISVMLCPLFLNSFPYG